MLQNSLFRQLRYQSSLTIPLFIQNTTVLHPMMLMASRSFAWTPVQKPLRRWSIVKDDFVEVLTGRQRKQQGKVMKVFRKKNQVLVQGVNLKYITIEDEEMQRRKKVVQQEFPIHVSNVALVDPELNVATRIRHGYLEDGTPVRVSKKTGAVIPKPERTEMKYILRTKDKEPGDFDTRPEDVIEKTYQGEDFVKVYNEFQEYIRIKETKEEELLVFRD